MKIRRFVGKDMNEAIIKVKSELGSEAVILNSRKIKRSGILGFFKKPLVEVVAAIDQDYKIKTTAKKKSKKKSPSTNSNKRQVNKEIDKTNISFDNKNIDLKINKLTEIVKQLENKVSTIDTNDTKKSEEKKENTNKSKVKTYEKKYLDLLIDHDIFPKNASRILDQVKKKISIKGNSEETVKNAIKVVISDFLQKPKVIPKEIQSQKIFMFVGPTGVGKTTTLAKLAAKLSLIDNKKVGLITADTYRIAAVEQLKTYSEILGIPLNVVYESKEIQDAIDDYEDKDYILIDTAGRNYKDKDFKVEIEEIIERVDNIDKFLVLSLVADYKNMKRVIKSYEFLDDYRVIFTKFDEAITFGNILNIKMLTNKKLSYITNGQSVPDDIEVLNIDKVADIIVGDSND
ncbi:MAG: flagellar biosynthesis protein FlhF [Bacillota bacterium]